MGDTPVSRFDGRRPSSRLDRLMMAALALYSGVVALRLISVIGLAHLFWDDGYYYLQIARNIARGAGPTLDGLHPTNGYHPLWLLGLVPIFRLAPGSDAALAAVSGLQIVLMAAASAFLYLIARHAAGRAASVIAVLFWIHLTYRLGVSGLEYALYSATVLGATLYYLRHVAGRPPRVSTDLTLGCLLALVFLSRLESIALAGTTAWVEGWRRRARKEAQPGWIGMAALAGPAVGAVLVCGAVNAWLFGSPTPVSAAVKRAWSALALAADPYYQASGWLAAKLMHLAWPLSLESSLWTLTLIAGTWGVSLGWLARCRLRAPQLEPLGPLILFSVVGFVAYAVVYHGAWSATLWYYVVPPVLAALLLAYSFEALGPRSRSARAVIAEGGPRMWLARAAALGVAAALIAIPVRTMRDIGGLRLAVATWAEPALHAIDQLPPDAILASWNSGTLTYRSGRTVVNLDGLVNSWDYFREKRSNLCGYWRETGVTHLVDFFDFTADPPIAPLLAQYRPLYDYRACGRNLTLVWADERQPASARMAIFALPRTPAP